MEIETNNGTTEKFIPHPILDDPEKMMRIIANPVYDKLTLSRAAHIQKSVRITVPNGKPMVTLRKSLSNRESLITVLPTNNNLLKRPNPSTISLLPRSSTHRNSRPSVRSRADSIYSSFTDTDRKPSNTESTVRYINSRHGLEIQRYSSPNWLSIDLLTKDACESEDKTFREMLDKKEQNDLSNSRTVYNSEYYRQRFEDLLQSYQNGHLTHDQWARQNYQLHCLKTFYIQACEREQQEMNLYKQNLRQRQSECVFNQWKQAKGEGQNDHRRNRIGTGDITSVVSNPSSSILNRMSIVSIPANVSDKLPTVRSKLLRKPSMTSYMFNEERWSLDAMLKRIVGLAEPLPSRPLKMFDRRSSILTNLSYDSGFESSGV